MLTLIQLEALRRARRCDALPVDDRQMQMQAFRGLIAAMGLACVFALVETPAALRSASLRVRSVGLVPAATRTSPRFPMPTTRHEARRAPPLFAASDAAAISESNEGKKFSLDVPLLLYFFFWYLGNYYYNIANKLALKAAGGAAGFPMTISTLQLLVGSIYATFLWIAPDSRPFPKTTPSDIVKLLPVAFCAAGAHASSVFALSAGAVSFGQIVKAAEPAFAAVLGTLFYGKSISRAKWLCLIPVIGALLLSLQLSSTAVFLGGVVLASVKELDFAVSALIAASIANLFAAVKANENKKCMDTPGLKDRIGSVGNQFAITTILAFLFSLPLVFFREGHKLAEFATLWNENAIVRFNIIASGLYFYGYNELATLTIKKTSAVTQSVANTAKRVIVIVGVALVLGESLPPLKILGCAIGIGGVFLYSLADNIWKPKPPN